MKNQPIQNTAAAGTQKDDYRNRNMGMAIRCIKD